jgi:hypothetical protein
MPRSTKLSWISAVVVLALALMLWLPVGQTPFLIENWMKIGTFFIPFILLITLSFGSTTTNLLDDARLASALMLATYLAHQFEEHWVDLLGEHYAFYYSANALLNNLLNTSHFAEILTPETIFFINTSLVWLVGAIAIWRSPSALFPSLALAGIMLVNALTHVAGAVVKSSYNPGLLSAVILFIPLSVAYYWRTLRRLPKARGVIFISVGWAVFAHVLMIGGFVGFHVVLDYSPSRLF